MSDLLPSQKADLFNLILAHNLSPASFTMSPAKDDRADHCGQYVSFKGSRYYFQIRVLYTQFQVFFTPAREWETFSHTTEQWGEVLSLFSEWLSHLNRELTAPDPWANIAKASAVVSLAPAPNASNNPFSYQELEGIWKGLTAIQETLLNETTGAEEHRHLIESQMLFLVDSSKKMGRKDWLILAVGSLVTISTAMSLTPETTKTIFQLLKQAVAGAVQLLGG